MLFRSLAELAACKQAFERAFTNGGTKLGNEREICKLKYIPGRGFFESCRGVEREISEEEIDRLYTGEALRLVRNNPRIWCAILREHGPEQPSASGSDYRGKGRNPQPGDDVLNWLRSITPSILLS